MDRRVWCQRSSSISLARKEADEWLKEEMPYLLIELTLGVESSVANGPLRHGEHGRPV